MSAGAQLRAKQLRVLADLVGEHLPHFAADVRVVCDDLLQALGELDAARAAEEAMRRRHDEYVAYHAAHCFNRDGTTRSGIPAAAFGAKP